MPSDLKLKLEILIRDLIKRMKSEKNKDKKHNHRVKIQELKRLRDEL